MSRSTTPSITRPRRPRTKAQVPPRRWVGSVCCRLCLRSSPRRDFPDARICHSGHCLLCLRIQKTEAFRSDAKRIGNSSLTQTATLCTRSSAALLTIPGPELVLQNGKQAMHESKLNPKAHNCFGKSMRRSFSVMGMPVLKAPPVEDPVSELEAARG